MDIEETPQQGRGTWIWFRIFGLYKEVKDNMTSITQQGLFQYLYGQFEENSTNGLHLHGYGKFWKKQAPSTISKLLSPQNKWGLLKNQNDIDKMIVFCHKEETQAGYDAIKYGEVPIGSANKERQGDKQEHVSEIVDLINKQGRLEALFESTKRGYSKREWDEALCESNHIQMAMRLQTMKRKAENIKWKPWQQWLVNYLEVPHDREILVVLDNQGNSGKTFFMKNYKMLHADTTVNLSNGKTGDLMYVIAKTPLVETIFVNLPKSLYENVNYQAIEQAKDGEFTTTKYNGKEITIEPTNTIIFTNKALDWDALIHDRWRILTITEDKFVVHNYHEYKQMEEKAGVDFVH